MAISTDAHPMGSRRPNRNARLAMVVGGPRWNRLLERRRLSSEAMAVARPFNGILATLEAQIAELRAAVDRGDTVPTGPGPSDRADRLGRSVHAQQLAFADATTALASAIKANDRIKDTRRALDSAAAAIECIQKLLAKHRRRPPTLVA